MLCQSKLDIKFMLWERQDGGGIGRYGVHLSYTDTSGIHLETRSACRIPAESRDQVPDKWKRIYKTFKTLEDEGTKGKRQRVLMGTGYPWVNWKPNLTSNPLQGSGSESEENI